jgi:hypothetical protein
MSFTSSSISTGLSACSIVQLSDFIAFSPRTQSTKGPGGKDKSAAPDSPRGENHNKPIDVEASKKQLMGGADSERSTEGAKSGRKFKRDNVDKR